MVYVWLSFSWFITVQLQTVSCFFHLVFISFVVHFQLPYHGVDSFLSWSLVFVCFQFYKLTRNNQHVLGSNPFCSRDFRSFELTDSRGDHQSLFITEWFHHFFLLYFIWLVVLSIIHPDDKQKLSYWTTLSRTMWCHMLLFLPRGV